jgi:phosphate transport system permease protein
LKTQTRAGGRRTQRRLLADKLATLTVRGGGLAIIASIVAIVVFLIWEVLPLLKPADVREVNQIHADLAKPQAMVSDPYRTHIVGLGEDGQVRAIELANGTTVSSRPLAPAGQNTRGGTNPPGSQILAIASEDGQIHSARVTWEITFPDSQRQVAPVIDVLPPVRVESSGTLPGAFAMRHLDEGGRVTVAQKKDGRIVVVFEENEENLFTEEITSAETRSEFASTIKLRQILVDDAGRNAYASAAGGKLLWWDLRGAKMSAPRELDAGGEVTALTLLIGGRSLVVGQASGEVSIWFPVKGANNQAVLTRIRDMAPLKSAITKLSPSRRNKGFLAATATDELGLYYSTSNRQLWSGQSPIAGLTAMDFGPKADAAYLAGAGAIATLDIVNPHPETSLQALFGEVWYESYPKPDRVWQSSSGTDDFEPKFSLVPLLVGTLKGTFYSLLLAVPLAVLGAMFVSHFMSPGLKAIVKPMIEIMAAMPSVVLGFLAGLWLAPRLEEIFPSVFLMAFSLPLLLILTGFCWSQIPPGLRNRLPAGIEVLPFMIVLGAGIFGCIEMSLPFENLVFGGDFARWLRESSGLAFDQRNAIVVGMAMGFAVIPIIFAISEDAFSNVPKQLVSGSLALGATLWQTVTRVVVPTASPGIFSAIMVGFGRAVGETMIVLMATGNTPIMDWNPFNGFRTLSANIAVEIPEAPQFSTLYRTLFLAALLLFILTFIVNTAAEIVRHRLRERYGKL